MALLVGATSCREKPDAPAGRSRREADRVAPAGAAADGKSDAEEETEPSKVGVGDFVDYAIGKKQMEIGKRMKAKIRDIESDRNRRIEEQMGE